MTFMTPHVSKLMARSAGGVSSFSLSVIITVAEEMPGNNIKPCLEQRKATPTRQIAVRLFVRPANLRICSAACVVKAKIAVKCALLRELKAAAEKRNGVG